MSGRLVLTVIISSCPVWVSILSRPVSVTDMLIAEQSFGLIRLFAPFGLLVFLLHPDTVFLLLMEFHHTK